MKTVESWLSTGDYYPLVCNRYQNEDPTLKRVWFSGKQWYTTEAGTLINPDHVVLIGKML